MAFFDAEGRCLLWNRRYAELAPPGSIRPEGFTLKSLLETGLAQGRYAEACGREAEWLAARLEAYRDPAGPTEHQLMDGSWLRVQERRTPDGGTVTVCSDVTELKARNEVLTKAKADAEAANLAKSQFLANMSHEIRTPLNGVVAMADLLSKRKLPAREREMAEMIRSSGVALERLLSDILDLARIESGKMTIERGRFDLGELVRSVVGLSYLQAREKGLQLKVELALGADEEVLGDAVRTRQILWNLVSNAVKFTDSGKIWIRASRQQGDLIRLEVEDTGCGFDPATKSKMFERFEQADGSIVRSHGGAGLGLAIARKLAELAGGSIDCDGREGRGARFWCDLPLESAADSPRAAAGADSEPPAKALRALLVDDHPTNRKVIQLLLSSSEAEVVEAENGAEALEKFAPGRFDVVLMDMQMPVMDGLTAVREIRRLEPSKRTPVIMLTANAMAEHVEASRAAGADLHLSKPLTAAKLFEGLEQAIAISERQAEAAA
ncbi:MAG: Signal peptide protein, partial [Caulobacteraceae bacterium]|nr:Signal peptide protein [Caulobacteraceae bacterium]